MYESVRAYLERNPLAFSDNEEFMYHYNDLVELLNRIGAREDKQLKATTGKVKDKTISRRKATNATLAIAGALYAYARKTGDVPLMESVNLTRAKLNRFRDANLAIELNSIRDKADQYKDHLIKFGITAEKLTGYSAIILNYINSFGAKVHGVATRTSTIGSLGNAMNEASDLLKAIDKLMENYSESDPEFYSGYKAARVVKNLGVRYKTNESPPDNGEPGDNGSLQPEKK